MKHNLLRWQSLLKWLLISAFIGVVVGGIVGTAFYHVLKYVTAFRRSHPYMLYFLPIGGCIIVYLYSLCGVKKSKGTNLVIKSIRSNAQLPWFMAPLMFVSTAITHLFGGSSGREGAILQIGGGLGYGIGKYLKLDDKSLRVVTMCGMAAGFSALFGMPVVAGVFVMEVISVGQFHYGTLLPICVSSVIARGLSSHLGAVAENYSILAFQNGLHLKMALQTCLIAAVCGVVAILFCHTLHSFGKWFSKWMPNPYVRIIVCSFVFIAVNLLIGTDDYQGTGSHIIELAMEGHAKPEAFLLKIFLTALTLEAGFKGGEIVPSLFIGSTLGCTLATWIGLDPKVGAAIGLISLFCGVVNCPLSALLMGCAMFGYAGAPYLFLATSISYVLSGYSGLYNEQMILYSKFHPNFINKKVD